MLDINPQFHIQLRKMHPDVKIKLKKEIEVFLEKNPESNVSDLRRFLKLGSTGDLIAQFKKSSFSMFLKRNYEKFKETGSCSQHKCGNGRKKTAARTRARIKALLVNKKKRSLRGVAGLTRSMNHHIQRPSTVLCMQILSVRKLHVLLVVYTLLAMPFSKMMEQPYTAVLLLWLL